MRKSIVVALLAGTLLFAESTPFAETEGNQPANPSASENSRVHFPREAVHELGQVVMHAPQIESWERFETITGASAFEATLAGTTETHMGSVDFKAQTANDIENRIVTVHDTEIVAINLPGVPEKKAAVLRELVRSVVRTNPQSVPLDLALEYVADILSPPSIAGLSTEPPAIFFSTERAILVIVDGDTLLAPIEDLRLQFVINTNWDVFFDPRKSRWYLLNGGQWLTTEDLDAGPWKATTKLPKDFKKLPNNKNWARVKANVPAPKTQAAVPAVYVSHVPAELIVLEGEPALEAIGETELFVATNTESEIFKYQGQWYYLVSGRWFRTTDVHERWEPVSELPDEFAKIPPDHALASVRASVPGTQEALLATLEAQIPRKATVSRDGAGHPSVGYQGDPEFVPIEGTTLQRAVNTGSDVIMAGDGYYLCTNAVWYEARSPTGPWTLADTIPAEIYRIPPSSPVYHTTYVNVYESSPTSVTYGYTPGYFGMYVSFGIAVYGTGWYYPPYYWYGYGHPVYYPYPYSYGSSAWYNPNTGAYGRGSSVYGPYGGYGRSAVYNPETGAYARGEAVWDTDEIAGSAIGYNPRTGTGIATNRYANESGAWGETVITRGDAWVHTQGEFRDGTAQIDYETSRGTSGQLTRTREGARTDFESSGGAVGTMGRKDGSTYGIAQSAQGDLYAGKDGDVYKRTDDGWAKRNNGQWQQLERPSTTDRSSSLQRSLQSQSRNRDRYSQLNRDYSARASGYNRYNSFSARGGRAGGRAGARRRR